MMGNGAIIWLMATASTNTSTALAMKASGKKTNSEAKVKKPGLTAQSTLVISKQANKHGFGIFNWADGSQYFGKF